MGFQHSILRKQYQTVLQATGQVTYDPLHKRPIPQVSLDFCNFFLFCSCPTCCILIQAFLTMQFLSFFLPTSFYITYVFQKLALYAKYFLMSSKYFRCMPRLNFQFQNSFLTNLELWDSHMVGGPTSSRGGLLEQHILSESKDSDLSLL